MNNGSATAVFVAVLALIAAISESTAGHWLNVAGIIVGSIAIGLLARWLVKRLT